jgi:hypothetical protein
MEAAEEQAPDSLLAQLDAAGYPIAIDPAKHSKNKGWLVLRVKDMDPNFILTEEESSVLKLTAVPEMEQVEEPALVFIPRSWTVYLWDPSVKMLMPFHGPHADHDAIASCTG